MSEATTNTATAATAPAAHEADLADAFGLSIREAAERLRSISPEERGSNTAIERAARATLQFLRAAAQAQGLARNTKKDDETNDPSGNARSPSLGDYRDALADLRADAARQRSGAPEGGAGGGGDRSPAGGGDRL